MTNSLPSRPQARHDVELVHVGSDGVLYDPVSERVYRVNATGKIVWQCCDGSASIDGISTDLADAFDEPVTSVMASVLTVLERYAARGLLEGTVNTAPDRQTHRPGPPPDEEPVPVEQPCQRLGPYQALDLQIWIDCHDTRGVAGEVERALQPLQFDDVPGESESHVTLVVWSDGAGGWNLETDGARLRAPDESVVCDFVLWQVTRLAIEHSPRYLVLHASAVARDGVAVIFPAQSNSGKSTLATILVEAGFSYLTDEAVAIDLDSGKVVAYPKPITLDPGTQQLLPHLDPGGLAGRSPKWRIAPTEIRPDSVVDRAVLTHLVFPTHEAGVDNRLAAMDTIDAVVGVLSSAFNLGEHVDRLDDIVELVEGCTRHTFQHDGIEAPIAAIELLFGP